QTPIELRWMVYRKRAASLGTAHISAVTTHINAPRERVFDAAVDPARAHQFFKPLLPLAGISRVEISTVSEPAAPATRRVTWSDGATTEEEILELDRPFRQGYRWTNTLKGPLALLFRSAEASWMFTPTPTGTAVYWSYRFEPRNRYTEPLMNIVVGGFRRWMQASLQHLREQLER
ncbi:MAG: SRPBCC family protein, partial [Polyangiales bacterium]